MKEVKISMAREIVEKCECIGIVILAFGSDGRQHVTTYGKTVGSSHAAAKLGNDLKRDFKWPIELCDSTPLERICENCSFFKENPPFHAMNMTERSEMGKCFFGIEPVPRKIDDRACHDFEGLNW